MCRREPSVPGVSTLQRIDCAASRAQELNDSVVDQDGITRGDVVNQAVVIHVDGIGLLTLRAADGELENVPRREFQIRRQIAGANGRPLCIEQDRHRSPDLIRDPPNLRHNLPHPIMARVAHVESENVGALHHQLPEHVRLFRGRPERADDLGFAHLVHASDCARESKVVFADALRLSG